MSKDAGIIREQTIVSASTEQHETIQWRAQWRVEKWNPGSDTSGAPDEVTEHEGNLLMYGGASALWDLLIGAGNVTAFNNSNAYIGVGDSNTAAAATQTDLQASTNKVRVGMEASYPSHTDGTSSGNASVAFRSVFGTSSANFAWEEWGIFNASTSGRMLNRKVESLGTKASGATWTFTVTLSLS